MEDEKEFNLYNSKHETITINYDDQKELFDLSIETLNLKYDTGLYKIEENRQVIVNRAINTARKYIDKLIDDGNFIDAKVFSREAESKILQVTNHNNQISNFFEVYNYRIIDREYIYNAKQEIKNIEQKSESKIYEVLTIFITIVTIIFSFVNGGNVKIFNFNFPVFIILAITIIFSWWFIKYFNSKIK